MEKRKCQYCNQKLNGGSKHIYFCGAKYHPEKTKELIKKEFLEFNFPEISNKKNLTLQYEINLKSLPDLKKEYNIDFKSILFLLNFYEIKKRTSSESAKKISSKKHVKTCNTKYGVDNVSQIQDVKNSKTATFIEHYGVDNIRKSESFKDWLKNHMKETYGTGSLSDINGNRDSWGWKKLTQQEKNDRLKIMFKNFESKIEKQTQGILTDLGVGFSTQFFVNNQSFDIKINKTKKLIEVQGDYWHGNPNIYKPTDNIVNKNLGKITAKEIWEHDFNKKIAAEQKGYKVLYLWEMDLKSKPKDEIKILIINFLFE